MSSNNYARAIIQRTTHNPLKIIVDVVMLCLRSGAFEPGVKVKVSPLWERDLSKRDPRIKECRFMSCPLADRTGFLLSAAANLTTA